MQRNSKVDRVWAGDFLLGKDKVPQATLVHCLRRIGSKTITYKNPLPLKKQTFILKMEVKYGQYIIVAEDTKNLGIVRNELIQVI